MKRVLFVSSKPFLPWRGPCIRTGHDLRALTQLGYEVDFLTVPIGAHAPVPGVRILYVPNLLLARALPEGPSLRKAVFDLLLLARAAVLALRNRYDVAHGLDDAGIIAWLAGRLGRGAVIVEQHAATSREPGSSWRRLLMRQYRRVERFALRRADAAIGAGAEFVPALQALGRGSRACRIPDVPSALDAPPTAQVAACRARLLRNLDDLLVTCTVPFAGARELDALFDALPRVHAQNDRVHFVVLGGGARETARWQRALAARKTRVAITFLAPATPAEFATVLAASDILAAPHCDGASAPMRLLDYLQSGTAIVAMDCPAHRDILSPEAALLTRPTPDAFADGILALSRDPARRHELGLRGRELLARSRSFEQFRDSLRRCYDYVTSQTTGLAS